MCQLYMSYSCFLYLECMYWMQVQRDPLYLIKKGDHLISFSRGGQNLVQPPFFVLEGCFFL